MPDKYEGEIKQEVCMNKKRKEDLKLRVNKGIGVHC